MDGLSWQVSPGIYAVCNGVPCGMDAQTVACVPKNAPDVWIP